MSIYNETFYEYEGKKALSSAEIILPYIINKLGKINSVVDFGCGTGEWLQVAKKCGVNTICGLDGAYAEKHLVIGTENFKAVDFCETVELYRKYDLALSLEVAEHIPKSAARTYIGSVVKHADIVLFSAAIPGQGGSMHINEQYPTYWEKIFKENGFDMCDCIRKSFWDDERVACFYKQNIMIFCKSELKERIQDVFANNIGEVKDIVHPEMFALCETRKRIFPFELVPYNNNVIIYGAGSVGREFMNQLYTTQYAKVVLWCDSAFEQYISIGLPIENPENIKKVEYDCIVIAVENEQVAIEISNRLLECGVPEDRIIWRYPKIQNKY